MNSKTETSTTSKAKSVAETGVKTAVEINPEKVVVTPTTSPKSSMEAASQPATQSPQIKHTNDLSPELLELLTELRDTVKGLNPRKHTAKTLRRALSNISAILADIDKLYQQD